MNPPLLTHSIRRSIVPEELPQSFLKPTRPISKLGSVDPAPILQRPLSTSYSHSRAVSSASERSISRASSLGRPESRLSRLASPDRPPPIGGINSAILTREIEDLKSKLKLMELKRREDIEKQSSDTKELSHVKNVAKRLELKLAPMHQEIVELRGKLKDLETENYGLHQEAVKTDEIIELSTLDKEMAEEKCENLLLELNELKARWEDLEFECESLREENELHEVLRYRSDGATEDNAVIDNTWLVKKNEQLQNALLKFRDLMQEKESSYQDEIKKLESNAADAQNVSDSYTQVKRQLADAESIVADLRLQLDNALGAEDMIETLTEKNLELQEKIEELEHTIDELETLKALNDELESNHLLTEKQLLAEVDELEELHNSNQEKLVQSQERNVYLESAVSKFKEMVTIMDSDLADLRTSNQHMNADSAAMAQHTKSLMELNFKLNSTAVEANSKAIDLQLGKFEARQALDQLEIVKCYLSDSYSVDELAIEALLRLDRIAFKSEIVETFLLERTAAMTSNSFSVVEYTKIFISLTEVRRYSLGLAFYVRSSSVDAFQQCGSYYTQTEQVEAVLTSIIDIVKADTLQEKSFSKDLDTILNKLWVLYTDCAKEMKESEPQHVLAMNDLSSIQLASRLISDLHADLVAAMKEISLDPESDPVMTGIKSNLGPFSRIKVLATRISYELESLYDDSKILPQDLYEYLAKINAKCKVLVRFFASVLQRLRLSISELKSLSTIEVIELFKKQFSNVYEPEKEPSTNITLVICEKLEEIVREVKQFSLTDSTLITLKKPAPPWIQNENQLASIKVNQAEKEKEVEALKLEVQRLATNVRSRDKSIEELQVRLGLLNSRMEKSKEQVVTITKVKKLLADSLAEEKQLHETIAKLRKSLEDQEKQISKYKKQGFKPEVPFSNGDYFYQTSFDNVAVAGLQNEIKSLRAVVSHLTQQSSTGEDDYTWLDRPARSLMIFQSQEIKYRVKARNLFTDIRKSVLECNEVSIVRPKQNGRKLRSSNTAESRLLAQKDTAAKIRLIVSSLAK